VWSVGQRIGEYELIAHLRSGGMAMLFLAKRSGAAGFTREVAIKIVNPELAVDSQFRTMFLDEAMLSSRIQHPNVVHVEELAEYEGSHYLVMEYVHGCSLSQLQRQLVGRGRRLSPSFATRIAMHVADALHAAHETRDPEGRPLGVVHRDVSPENILLAYAGHVKLIDFGIAKAYGRRHKTQEGLLKGKFRYMAPEQAYGKPIDRRTDVYQLGIVLWEMLTLRRLFDAETDVDLLAQVREPRIPPPSALVDRIPPRLDAAVMAALDPSPDKRPADAQTFARMLAKAVPEAHEVDSGALSALVVATMHEHRQRERSNFPAQVYEHLDQQVQTLQVAGSAGAAQPVIRKYTLEHTSPYGSDSGEAPGAQAASARSAVRVEPQGSQHSVAAQGSQRSLAAPRRSPRPPDPGPRQRRHVRLASEIRTTITRIAGEGARERRLFGLVVGGAIGLAGALALITLALRDKPTMPPPIPVPVAAQRAQLAPQQALAQPPKLELPGGRAADAGVGPLDAPAAIVAPAAGAREHEPGEAPARSHDGREHVAKPVDIDGTPMIPAL
jgi:serine/threonine-protein kinase